ncbi:transcription factor E2F6 isoform X2 [Pseudoliparis swirei]|uniref:transcription factor E2F6 isoform X2 n=1 Tax=Pseudoliparis swirei TaxID=2059687 RepID=UPI0024BED5D3|nr:transcription factor E2F6 isoform X2 [Pseudoliparis swirei]
MVKCVVSGCQSRVTNVPRGIFNRPPKRFFNFPEDTARVKVWLAALRETQKQDSTDQHLICEDHFLPEDISASGVNGDAIPIMPPYLDGPMGRVSPWGAESSSSEEEEEEGEAAHWAPCGGEEDEEDEDAPVKVEPPEPPEHRDPGAKKTSETKTPSLSPPQKRIHNKRTDVSLGVLTRRFLELLAASPDGSVDLRHVATVLQTRRRRVYDITNVLEGISLMEKESTNKFKWIGSCRISGFLRINQQKFQRELENLKLVEETLDSLIKSCAQQLFDMTDDAHNARSAYVTAEDVGRLAAFREQTVLVVKAPEETKLEVPAPKEDSIQVHLKGGRGPITVLTYDIVAEGDPEKKKSFLTLEESRIATAVLLTGSSSPQSA